MPPKENNIFHIYKNLVTFTSRLMNNHFEKFIKKCTGSHTRTQQKKEDIHKMDTGRIMGFSNTE